MSVPILRLRLAGYCGSLTDGLTCGAFSDTSKEEQIEQKALQDAACSLQAVPILWYRKVREKKRDGSMLNQRSKNHTSTESRKRSSSNHHPQSSSPTSVAAENTYDDKLFKLQSRNPSGLNNMFHTSLFDVDDEHKQDKNKNTDEGGEERSNDDDDLYYAGIEAVMSVCDSEDGPALEIKAHGLQFSIFQNNFDIIDIDPKYDLISSFLLEGNRKGQDFLERTIPLSLISHASPGGYWDWKNMLNLTSGNCDCAVKVYGVPPDDALILPGKKLLLFDVLHSAPNIGIDRDKLIESLNVLIVWNKEQMEIESQVLEGDGKKKKSTEKVIEDMVNDALCC